MSIVKLKRSEVKRGEVFTVDGSNDKYTALDGRQEYGKYHCFDKDCGLWHSDDDAICYVERKMTLQDVCVLQKFRFLQSAINGTCVRANPGFINCDGHYFEAKTKTWLNMEVELIDA